MSVFRCHFSSRESRDDNASGHWIPAPLSLRVDALALHPGGAFVTHMSEDGESFSPHVDAVVLVVEDASRLVFTNAVNSSWHPALPCPVAMTTEIMLTGHEDGTDYRAVVRHDSPEQRARHEEVGFFDGWGTVTEQLAKSVE